MLCRVTCLDTLRVSKAIFEKPYSERLSTNCKWLSTIHIKYPVGENGEKFDKSSLK